MSFVQVAFTRRNGPDYSKELDISRVESSLAHEGASASGGGEERRGGEEEVSSWHEGVDKSSFVSVLQHACRAVLEPADGNVAPLHMYDHRLQLLTEEPYRLEDSQKKSSKYK
jgi:hypothetical protein